MAAEYLAKHYAELETLWPMDIKLHANAATTPRTNGMIERLDGRIADIINTTRFASSAELEKNLLTYADTYVRFIPQRALGHKTPLEALHDWHEKAPECSRARLPHFPRPDTRRAAYEWLEKWLSRPGPRRHSAPIRGGRALLPQRHLL